MDIMDLFEMSADKQFVLYASPVQPELASFLRMFVFLPWRFNDMDVEHVDGDYEESTLSSSTAVRKKSCPIPHKGSQSL